MTNDDLIKIAITAGLTASLTLIVQYMLMVKREISEQNTSIKNRRSTNHLRRHDHLAKLVTLLNETLLVMSQSRIHAVNIKSKDEETAKEAKEQFKVKEQRMKELSTESVIVADLYGQMPESANLDELWLSIYVRSVFSGRLLWVVDEDIHPNDFGDAYKQGRALLNDVRTLLTYELTMAEEVMRNDKRTKKPPISLPYLEYLRVYFPKKQVVIKDIDTMWLEPHG